MANDTTVKFRVDISELRKQIQEANRHIRLAKSEFEKSAAGLDDWTKSADGVSSKAEELTKILENQETILKKLKEQHRLVYEAEGKNSKGAEELEIKINKQEATVTRARQALEKFNDELGNLTGESGKAEDSTEDLRTATEKLQDTIDEQQTELDKLKTKYMDVVLEEGKNSDSAQNLADQIDKLSSELNDNQRELANTESAADDLDNTLQDVDGELDPVSGGFTVLTGALADLVADGIRKAIDGFKDLLQAGVDYESAFTDVRKTVNETEEGYAQLDQGIKDMSSRMPQSAADIAEVTAAAGQLGIEGVDNLLDFTETMIMLGDATDLSSDDAASLFARFANITGMDFGNISNLGSTVAALGNNFATTESEIGEMALRLAGAGTQVGMTEPQILAMAAALSSVGIESEAGGSAFSKLMSKIAVEVSTGGAHLEQYAEVAGMSVDEFKTAFETDALGAIQAFLGGINKMDGNDAIVILNDMELSEVRLRDAILRSSGAIDSFNGAVDLANTSWDENTALQNEAQQRYETTASKIEIMKNQFRNVGTTLLDVFSPAIEKGISFLENFADGLQWVVEHLTDFIDIIEPFSPIIITVASAFGLLATKLLALKIITKVSKAFVTLNAVMAANPITLIIGAIIGLVAAFVILWNKSEAFREFWINLWEKIKEVTSIAWEAISGFFSGAWEKVKEVWGGLKEFFSGLWESAKEIFSTVAQWIFDNVFQPIMNFFQPVVDFFTTAFEIIFQLAEGCWNLIKLVWEIVSDWFKEHIIDPITKFFTELWNTVKSTASATWDAIKNVWNVVSTWFNNTVIQPVSNFFSKMWDGVKSAASTAWEGIKSVFAPVAEWFEEKFKKAWQKVKDVFSTGGKIFDGIKDGIVDAFKTVVNAIIRGINKVIAIPFNAINNTLDKIKNISIAGAKPFSGLISRFDVPEIPELAKGGVLRKGQVGLLEGNGTEAVVPLEKNTRWLDEIASRLYNKMNMSQLRAPQTVNNNTVNNFNQTNNSPKSLSRLEIYRQSKNLLHMKGV